MMGFATVAIALKLKFGPMAAIKFDFFFIEIDVLILKYFMFNIKIFKFNFNIPETL